MGICCSKGGKTLVRQAIETKIYCVTKHIVLQCVVTYSYMLIYYICNIA